MDYYIQGNEKRADEIKAAFEKLGYKNIHDFKFKNEYNLYFSYNREVNNCFNNGSVANIIKTHPGYKELVLSVKPMFKVGDWVVGDDGIFNITQYEDEYGYELTETTGRVVHFLSPDYVESNFHLWRIEDAKDGDVLAADECYVIFKEIDGLNIKCYCTYHYMGFNTSFYIDTLQNKTAFKPANKEQCDLLFKCIKENGYTWDVGKKELRRIIEPMFKVGDWITDGISKCQIYFIDNTQYWYSENCILGSIESVNKRYHLWSIADAKEGDVLANDHHILILKELDYDWYSNGFPYSVHAHCGIKPNGNFELGKENWCFCGTLHMRPATSEERDLLFSKMREAGYEWDADKKELRKVVKEHYDISNFYAGMPVLVRDYVDEEWCYVQFSHIRDLTHALVFNAGCHDWYQCIPFNADTKHLLGTTYMCDEQYINW